MLSEIEVVIQPQELSVETAVIVTKDEVGIPSGGTTGQSIVKRSNADFDVTWANTTVQNNHAELINRDIANQHPISAITNLQTKLDSKIDSENKGVASGVASLDANAKVPSAQIPIAGTSIGGVKNGGNVTINADGTMTAQGGAVDSVNGKTGAVVLNATDVGALPSSTVIPTKTSDLTNDSGFIDNTYHDPSKANVSTTYTKTEVDTALAGKAATVHTHTKSQITDFPNIPTALADLTDDSTHRLVTDTEKSTWNAKYNKPSGGIPSTDMTDAVRTSLGKADTALQSVPNTYRTAAEQDAIHDSTKQDTLIAGANITIAADGRTISATGGGTEVEEVFIAEYNVTPFADVLAAYNAGKTLFCKKVGASDGLVEYATFSLKGNDPSSGTAFAFASTVTNNNTVILVNSDGWTYNTSTLARAEDIVSEVFIATYGTTTFNQIATAYNANKIVMCDFGNVRLRLNRPYFDGNNNPTHFLFSSASTIDGTSTNIRITCAKVTTNNEWYNLVNDLVSAETGKGLSTNDYDATAKEKVDAIPADPKYTDTVYDDTALKGRVTTLENEIDDIKYVAVSITSMSLNTPSSPVEIGSTVTSIKVSYAINKVPVTLTLEGTSITPAKSGTQTLTGLNLTSNKTFTMVAKDNGSSSKPAATSTKTATLSFLNRTCWGVASLPSSIDSAFINQLATKNLTESKSQNFTVNAGTGQYIWLAVPKRTGTRSFKVGGFDGGFEAAQTVSVTNASGYTEDYYVYRSTNAGLGSTNVIVS